MRLNKTTKFFILQHIGMQFLPRLIMVNSQLEKSLTFAFIISAASILMSGQ